MKKVVVILFCIVMVLVSASCNKQISIPFSFSIEDIEQINLYHFIVPADAEKKEIVNSKQIQSVMEFLQNIKMRKNTLGNVSGTTTTSFCFYLKDGTNFEVIYIGYGVKKGAMILPDGKEYQTAADVGSIWNYYDVPANKVEQLELPVILQ